MSTEKDDKEEKKSILDVYLDHPKGTSLISKILRTIGFVVCIVVLTTLWRTISPPKSIDGKMTWSYCKKVTSEVNKDLPMKMQVHTDFDLTLLSMNCVKSKSPTPGMQLNIAISDPERIPSAEELSHVCSLTEDTRKSVVEFWIFYYSTNGDYLKSYLVGEEVCISS